VEDNLILKMLLKEANRTVPEGHMGVSTLQPDGTWEHSSFEIPQDLQDWLAEARAEYDRLKAAGTPYWCIHEGREVSHPAAYWKEDGFFRADGLEIQYKHGVMCADCGGYIQEG
jgi:hypothetical protein